MKNKIIYKNFIPKKYLNKKYSKQIDKKYKKVIANLIQTYIAFNGYYKNKKAGEKINHDKPNTTD